MSIHELGCVGDKGSGSGGRRDRVRAVRVSVPIGKDVAAEYLMCCERVSRV